MENIIEMKGIVKRFGGFYANKGIDLDIRKGEIHALLGENGAGKTTLMNILYGLYPANEGEIWFDGKKVTLKGPGDAMRLSIGMVHQHFMLIPPFTVAENLVLGNESVKGLQLDMKAAVEKINTVSREYGMMVDPTALVSDISLGMQQRVELLKILLRGARVLIFDEPTAVLSPQEINEFFKICRTLQQMGHTIIIITHKLKEIKRISDRVTVIRNGENVGTIDTCAITEDRLAEMMVGRPVIMELVKKTQLPGEVVLEIKELFVNNYRGLSALNGISLQVRAGEIVGIAGVEGNGQTELAMALKRLISIRGGSIKYFGREYTKSTTTQNLINGGLAHIPEDRQRRGLIPGFSVKENLVLGAEDWPRFIKGPFLNQREITAFGEDLRGKYDIRCTGIEIPVEALSGGNQQKVILAREISRNPKLLIVCQPTRGLDVGAIEYIYAQILKQREKGCAILLISYELDEILSLSDRILAIYGGKIVAEYQNEEITSEQIGLAMAGFEKQKIAG
jgi:simple sugar transport system ATP-binding protein